MTSSIFVYGTLKRDSPGRAHRRLGTAKLVARGSVRGLLYDLGTYPGLVRDGSNGHRVFGELHEIPAASAERTLRLLDAYEGRAFKRERVFVTLSNGRRRAAWVYVLRRHPLKSARRLEDGRYVSGRGGA
jgi:gamma-glutamylcyclotransferase (GGCT)/AIG2-like uncharacterized protein YtfP